MSKFKLRKEKINEFTHCIQCWRQSHPTQQPSPSLSNTAGALFDVLGGINDPSNNQTRVKSKMRSMAYLDHHIFNCSFGWMIKESQKQPSIKLRISTDESDYQTFKKPCTKIIPSTVQAIADTGAQSSFMGLKVFLRCGFSGLDLLPVKKKMIAANSEGTILLLLHLFTSLLITITTTTSKQQK